VPRRELVDEIAADHEEKFCVGVRGTQLAQRRDGVARAAATNLHVAGFERRAARRVGVAQHRLHERETIGGWCHLALGRLLPRVVGDHEQHSVAAQHVPGRLGDRQVPAVRWVEGAAEHPESLRHSENPRSLGQFGRFEHRRARRAFRMDIGLGPGGGCFYRASGENCNIPLDIVRDIPVTSHFPEYPRNPPTTPGATHHPSWVSCGVSPTESIHNV